MTAQSTWQRHGVRWAALALVAGTYWAARLPATPASERVALAQRFRFSGQALVPPNPHDPRLARRVRPVHPSLERLSSWVSSVGGAAAIADLDGDGFSNDGCYVDTRTDDVVLAPLAARAGATPRYASFSLTYDGVRYDAATMAPMGCVPGDLDEDGRADLLVYYWGRTPLAFLQRGPAGAPLSAAAFQAAELVPGDERWFSNCAARADLDGDGHLDIVVGNYFADGARILDASDRTPQEMQDSMSRALNAGRNRLLRCVPRVTAAGRAPGCTEAAQAFDRDVARGWSLAVGTADLDGDQLPEIYFANDFGSDRLLHNRSTPGQLRFARVEGRRDLSTPRSKTLGRDSFKGMGVDFADLNEDGILDLYVSNIAADYALEESHFVFVSTGEDGAWQRGVAPYAERSEELGLSRSGWGWDARLADFDNDGALEALQAVGFMRGLVNRWPELHELAMGNDALLHKPGSWPRFKPGDDLSGGPGLAFFARDRRGRFTELSAEVGLGEAALGRALALADVEGDGDLDLLAGNQWAPPVFYRNDVPAPGKHLALRLLLPLGGAAVTRASPGLRVPSEACMPAVGAAVRVHRPGAAGPLVAQVDGGSGHSGRRAPELHFGLGATGDRPRLTVEIRWRDLAGHVRQETHELQPGWHTLVLASAPDREAH